MRLGVRKLGCEKAPRSTAMTFQRARLQQAVALQKPAQFLLASEVSDGGHCLLEINILIFLAAPRYLHCRHFKYHPSNLYQSPSQLISKEIHAMESKIEKEVRLLKIYVMTATVIFVAFIASAFTLQSRKQKFEEIDVERINVVEKDGKLRMVISNQERQHPGMVDGNLMPPRRRAPGIIFFNHKGDESGGLVFDENSGKGHFVSLTFDKSRQDQTIGIRHLEGDDGQYFAGFTIWDRPHTSLYDFVMKLEDIKKMPDQAARNAAMKELGRTEYAPERISIAKMRDKSARIVLSDARGRARIKISVDATGNPKMDFLDESGMVICSLPEAGKN
jgi:hypothetical protein